jgi:hypothetical protein
MAVSAGVSVLVSGRPGWIAAMVVGIVLIIVGAVAFHPANPVVIIAGAAIFVAGLIFLILSFVTGGQSD